MIPRNRFLLAGNIDSWAPKRLINSGLVNLLRSPEIDSQPGGIDALESIPGLLSLQIRALKCVTYNQ